MASACLSPIAFTRWPVTITLTIVYTTLLVALLVVHHAPPVAPADTRQLQGLNLSEAFIDLQHITQTYHPYNSHSNDNVRRWLLGRIEQILAGNDAVYDVVSSSPGKPMSRRHSNLSDPDVFVFDDRLSNNTAAYGLRSTYFEGTNIIVYVQGSEDDRSHWWDPASRNHAPGPHHDKRGVMVNAHYDSVSTGFGATDNGVAVVSALQLVKYYSQPENQPKRGFLALFNNGEEDFLNGARAFASHPMSNFVDTFVNLDGVGAGGRAAIFRATDADVTYSYQKSPHPFGTAVASDGFRLGLVSSQTDYAVFDGNLGLRGIDIAFIEPRSKYHTFEDSTRFTSEGSVWHMMSATLASTKALTSNTDTDFKPGRGADVVFFDLFGSAFAVFPLPSIFALSIASLVLGPLLLASTAFSLTQNDKFYLFAGSVKSDPIEVSEAGDEIVIQYGGWRGFFRFPIAFVVALVSVLALALLVARVNPDITYSSRYAVWSMMLCAVIYVLWFFLRGADYMRPSAFQRTYSLGWIYALTWVLLVGATAAADALKVGSGYLMLSLNLTSLVAVFISYLELFYLPRMTVYARQKARSQAARYSGDGERSGRQSRQSDDQEASETTSLLSHSRTSAWRGRRDNRSDSRMESIYEPYELQSAPQPHGEEQAWSGSLPSWTWFVQFALLGPFNIILVTQVGLFLTSGLSQTLSDSSASPLTVYMAVAVLSAFMVLPAAPFLHRISSRVPNTLLLVLIGCTIYNLTAFPFSDTEKIKTAFLQRVDLDAGTSSASLSGLQDYIGTVVDSLPSAAGNKSDCAVVPGSAWNKCTWGVDLPHVVGNSTSPSSWLSLKTKRRDGSRPSATFKLSGVNTKACRLVFDRPISDYHVAGQSAQDDRFPKVGEIGSSELRLWSREWDGSWDVQVWWDYKTDLPLTGEAVCLWSDQNVPGTIPALDEVKMYMPRWATVTKADDGLVQGFKRFEL